MAVEHAQILSLHKERLSQRPIVKKLQCSKRFVHRAIEKFKKHEIYDDMKKTCWPRITSRRDDHAIRQAVMRYPINSYRKVRSNLLKNGTDITISTIHVV